MTTQIPPEALVLCEAYESLSGCHDDGKYYPYRASGDSKEKLTIGRGHLLTTEEKKAYLAGTHRFCKGLTKDEVDALYASDIAPRWESVEKHIQGTARQKGAFDQIDGGAAGKNMCWILLARKAIRGEDYESEKSHIFVWDGETNQHVAPLSYVAATYAKPGAFGGLYTALLFGGDKETANLCDATKVDDARKMFDQFKDSPIKGEMPVIESTCDDTEFLRPSV